MAAGRKGQIMGGWMAEEERWKGDSPPDTRVREA